MLGLTLRRSATFTPSDVSHSHCTKRRIRSVWDRKSIQMVRSSWLTLGWSRASNEAALPVGRLGAVALAGLREVVLLLVEGTLQPQCSKNQRLEPINRTSRPRGSAAISTQLGL